MEQSHIHHTYNPCGHNCPDNIICRTQRLKAVLHMAHRHYPVLRHHIRADVCILAHIHKKGLQRHPCNLQEKACADRKDDEE